MILKVIACKVLSREISLLTPQNPHFLDVTYLRQGLHDKPDELRRVLQAEIDAIDDDSDIHSVACELEGKTIDAILLAYGLCSNGIQGLRSKKYPIIVPRAHDCITLLLGSKEKYDAYFSELNGKAYWYSPGWIENTSMPSKERYAFLKEKYTRQFGEDNAEYLLETELGWQKEYDHIAYVKWDGIAHEGFLSYAEECAAYFNWNFRVFQGDDILMRDMLTGNWDQARFLTVKPGESIQPSYDEDILMGEPARSCGK